MTECQTDINECQQVCWFIFHSLFIFVLNITRQNSLLLFTDIAHDIELCYIIAVESSINMFGIMLIAP